MKMKKEAGILGIVILASVVFVGLVFAGLLDGGITGRQILSCPGDYNGDGVVDYDDYFVNGSVISVVDENLGNVCNVTIPSTSSVGNQTACQDVVLYIDDVDYINFTIQTLSININISFYNITVSRVNSGTSELVDFEIIFDNSLVLSREDINQLYLDSGSELVLQPLSLGDKIEILLLAEWINGDVGRIEVRPLIQNLSCGITYSLRSNLALNKTVFSREGVNGCDVSRSTQQSCCLGKINSSTGRCNGFYNNVNPTPNFAVDNRSDTLWCSRASFKPPIKEDWVYVDLGSENMVRYIEIEQPGYSPYACAIASDYQIQIQDLRTGQWNTLKTEINSTSLNKSVFLIIPQRTRFVRFYVTKVADNTGWRLGVKEFKVYGFEPTVNISSVLPSTLTFGSDTTVTGSGFSSNGNDMYIDDRFVGSIPATNSGTKINFTIPSWVVPGTHRLQVISSLGKSNFFSLTVVSPSGGFILGTSSSGTVSSSVTSSITGNAVSNISDPNTQRMEIYSGEDVKIDWSFPSTFEFCDRIGHYTYTFPNGTIWVYGDSEFTTLTANLSRPGGNSGSYNVDGEKLDLAPAWGIQFSVRCYERSTVNPNYFGRGIVKALVVYISQPVCEEPFGRIISNLNNPNGQPVNITDDGFREWAMNDSDDRAPQKSGDVNDLTQYIARGLDYRPLDLEYSGVYNPKFMDFSLIENLFEEMNQLTSNGQPVLFVIDIFNPQGASGLHAVIATSVTRLGETAYSVDVVDPNGPSDYTLNCEFKESTYGYFIYDCGPIPLFGFENSEALPVGMRYPASLSERTTICNNVPDSEICLRNVAEWVSENYPSISNPVCSRTGQGSCGYWSEFVLQVGYLGEFIGENGYCI
jgi:hypothetical protein